MKSENNSFAYGLLIPYTLHTAPEEALFSMN